MSKIKFQPIDLRTLPRGEMFYYFSKMAPTGYSLTVSMDVTKLRQTLKEAGLKFFPAYLWLITKNLNQQMEFKMAIQEETLGYFNSLPPPFYATFHHAATDGYHIHLFLQSLQKDMDTFSQYINNALK